MQITVFGASGKVGRLVVERALSDGHDVTAFVHSHAPFEKHERLRIVKGDVGDRTAVAFALQGSDAIISALGSWGTPTKDIISRGTAVILPAMEEKGIRRIITLTGASAFFSQDRPGTVARLMRWALGKVAPKILEDGEKHLRLLESSDRDWTCVRSPVMTPGQSAYHLSDRLPGPFASIARTAVADALVEQLNTQTYLRQAPVIRRGRA